MDTINNFFAPLEHAIKKYQKYIRYFLYVLTFLSFGFLMMKNGTKESGEKAIFVLWIILWLPIFARVLDLGIARALMPLRKELGILMGTLALVHGFSFIIPNQSLLQDGTAVWGEGGPTYLFFGLIAMGLSVPLTLTSSSWAMRKMGKYWKYLHRLVYIIIIFVVVHVVLLKAFRGFEYGPVIILGLYFVGKILEWRGFTLRKSGTKTYPKGQKWICLPCGMIYDPVVGDIDSGVKPGTEFIDIPDSWRCPECGVSKTDFVPYDPETDIATTGAIVKEKKMLNPTTIELTVETDAEIPSLPGQFMSFLWEDAKGKFPRSYSIAKQEGKVYTFLIKVGKGGRGGALLEKLRVGESMQVRTISGKFILLENANPKIFIATGTGLAPIYRMIMSMDDDTRKPLYFSVSTEAELFYVDELRAIKNLDLHIHVTREKIDGYKEGRINIDSIEASNDTEWYLCGNPQMVKDAQEKLNKRGFTRVYSEEF